MTDTERTQALLLAFVFEALALAALFLLIAGMLKRGRWWARKTRSRRVRSILCPKCRTNNVSASLVGRDDSVLYWCRWETCAHVFDQDEALSVSGGKYLSGRRP